VAYNARNSNLRHSETIMTNQQTSSFGDTDRVLDASGLQCPLPLLKTKAELARMKSGETLLILATDRHAPIDLQVFCMHDGHEYGGDHDNGKQLEMLIRKGG
jgi:tRNA 2-thiouridine synthesizing protein A